MNISLKKDNPTITILHLSDLHYDFNHSFEIDKILDNLVEDIEKLKDKKNLSPDLVFISGDITNKGNSTDFRFVLKRLNKLKETLDIPKNCFMIVPGNHDVNRNKLRKHSSINFSNEKEVTDFLMSDEEKESVFKKLDNFYRFINNFYDSKNPFQGKLYARIKLKISDFNIGIVGLNSAWFSGENKIGNEIHDAKALLIGEHQVELAYNNMNNLDLCLSVLHHPLSYLKDFDEAASSQNNFDCIFLRDLKTIKS